jgi:hypothetical protein
MKTRIKQTPLKRQKGSASVLVLSVLIFLSALFLGAATFVELAAHGLARSRRQDEGARALRQAAGDTIEALLADPTPFADAPTDPVWSWLASPRGGLAVRLEDVSSRLGANWIRKELLQDTGALRPGCTASELQKFREDTGPHLDLRKAYGQFLQDLELERLFTAYGWFNINITDEFVLRRLHWLRGGDLQAAEGFRTMVQQARIQKRLLDREALPEFLGDENYRLLYPVVNAEAAMNVHFVPQTVLEGLFHHYGEPEANLFQLLAARQGAELTQGQLQELLRDRAGAHAARSPLSPFLGLQTWFWRITVEGRSQRLAWIVARVPRADGLPEYRRLEESR